MTSYKIDVTNLDSRLYTDTIDIHLSTLLTKNIKYLTTNLWYLFPLTCTNPYKPMKYITAKNKNEKIIYGGTNLSLCNEGVCPDNVKCSDSKQPVGVVYTGSL